MANVTLLVNSSLVFLKAVRDKDTNAVKVVKQFKVDASAVPQTAPDWVMETDTYKFASAEGKVHAINYIAPPIQSKTVPDDVASAFGFQKPQVPTLDSLMKSGLTMEAAQAALQTMATNKATPQNLVEEDEVTMPPSDEVKSEEVVETKDDPKVKTSNLTFTKANQ